MKKRLLLISTFIGLSAALSAQEYTTLQLTGGFNYDVIANGVGNASASTTGSVDNGSYAFLANNFKVLETDAALTFGLPDNGILSNPDIPALRFQLQDYSANNSLRLNAYNQNGTFTLVTPIKAKNLYIIGTSGSGNSVIKGTVTFSDGSTQIITNTSLTDWYDGTALPVVSSGIGRINRTDNSIDNPSGNPRIYQITIDINEENQQKLVASVNIAKANAGTMVTNIFGISAKLTDGCAAPTDLSSTVTANTASVSWTGPESEPDSGYDYYYSTDSTEPTSESVPSGTVGYNVHNVELSDLTTGSVYYFWVRSKCSDDIHGDWIPTTFLPGQFSVVYTAGDLATDKGTSSSLTTSSTSSCPGTLEVEVPAGYKIKEVKVLYSIQASNTAWKNEQRSILACTTNGATESQLYSGVGNSTGTYSYERSGLNLATGLTGNVGFELRSWRVNLGTGCNSTYQKVLNNTWQLVITYEVDELGIGQANNLAKLEIYPNPSTNFLNVKSENTIKEVSVFNQNGQLISSKAVNQNTYLQNVQNLPTGIYVIRIIDTKGKVTAKTFIKK